MIGSKVRGPKTVRVFYCLYSSVASETQQWEQAEPRRKEEHGYA
jgi:hypothetical protein